ncbi:hypothetical protein UFOVP583_18 [uncultured Caudovirales phage]|uniref:Uncharacterized protein n=1 Tax=uncultured Caudovirales phage TaxID=2100421 RepID=A0A6J5MZP2_9CAUD|nr:hypothetical protein UFOVP583_18 [uncultured Caudovirales phage]
MITKYYNRVEATELADLPEAERIVRDERAAGKHRFSLVPKGELKVEMDVEAFMDSLVNWKAIIS